MKWNSDFAENRSWPWMNKVLPHRTFFEMCIAKWALTEAGIISLIIIHKGKMYQSACHN